MQFLSLVDNKTRSSHSLMVLWELILVFALAIPGFAQTDTGSIVGTVRDASGVVIDGANVEITNTGTAVARSFITNSDGEYQALQLIPGNYTVKASQSGFATGVRENVTINVQTRAQVDFQLTVGAVTTLVQVEASTALLETQTAGVSGVVNTQELNDLPLNGRDYDTLVLTQPGIFRNNTVSNPAEGLFSANGNLQLQNYFQLDGIDNNSKSENLQEQSTQSVIPPPDALQEFVLQTRTYSAEFGTSAGAVVNVSTKSGTNNFHGDAWNYFQNGALNANTFFNNYNGIGRGDYNQNQFGGTIGGPIRRNHTFFFVAYEQLLSNIASTVNSVVPTAAMHNGDFSPNANGQIFMGAANRRMSPLVPSQAAANCISSPTSSYPNLIKPSCFDPVGKAVMDLYPLPSPQFGDVTIFTGNPNYAYTATLPNNTRTLDVRVDHTINPANQIFARYAFDWSDYQNPAPWTSNPIAGNGAGFPTTYILHDQSVAVGWTYTIKTNLTNTAHFGFLRTYSHSDPIGLTPGQSAAGQIGLKGVPNNPYVTGIPPFQQSGITSIGSAFYRPQYQVAQTYQILDAVYWLKGRHSFQFGYEYHQDALNFFDIQAPQGIIYNNGIFTNTNGFGAGDLLLGNVSQLILGTTNEINNYIRGNSFYAQDTWRASTNLTVNYGLRYELYPPFWLNRDGRTANFSCGPQFYPACIANGPAPNGGTVVTATGSGWAGATQMNTDLNNFAPRVGVSYHIFKPIVIRAGYGVFHQFINRIGSESMLQKNPPFLGSWNIAQSPGSTVPVFQLDSPNGMNSSAYLSQNSLALLLTPGPAVTCVTGTLINGVCVNGVAGGLPTQQIRAQGQDNRTSYIQQVSFGVQQQLTESTILSLNYIGNWGRKMNRLQNANQGFVKSCPTCSVVTPNAVIFFPLTSFNSGNTIDANTTSNGAGQHSFVELATNDGNTNFNALEANLHRQFKHGYAYNVSYTWSHNMANFVDNLTGGATPQNAHDYAHEMSNSFQDVRHRFVATGTYQLPIGKDGLILNNGGVTAALLGDWQLNGIVTLATGQPFNVTATNVSDTGGNSASYANCIGNAFGGGASRDPRQFAGTHSPGFFINPAAFSAPTLGTFGSCRPRAWHGPGLETVDLSLFKSFPIVREYRIETRFEAFNAFNHANFGNPAANISTSGANFGKVTTTTTPPRIFQIAAKFYF